MAVTTAEAAAEIGTGTVMVATLGTEMTMLGVVWMVLAIVETNVCPAEVMLAGAATTSDTMLLTVVVMTVEIALVMVV